MKIKKTSGELPAEVVVLDQTVQFDDKGQAEVEDGIGEVLLQIPGYEEYKEKPKKDPIPKDDSKGKKDDTSVKQAPPLDDQGAGTATPPESKE
ncbi:hypothetical protein [Paenibacillus sp. 23TSA30-6]|uniref:hypothetical protein n=1 Tax=Paenibacillus sp. 23TSA30-6 TaxID=2546104 RepID=UPI001787C5A6|nr:hypothetical protein [Paenibacillus sp. 23TSA30-6]MBE0335111.1 hypothetical protein [Paenibacillus sp. 23TSA30-6]